MYRIQTFVLLMILSASISISSTYGDIIWYTDGDGDGWGTTPTTTTTGPIIPAGFAALGFDCNDSDSFDRIGADDHVDGADNDCDGVTDEGDEPPTSLLPDTIFGGTSEFGTFTVSVGSNFSLAIEAGTSVSFFTVRPVGMTFSSSGAAGLFEWTPGALDLGWHKAEAYFIGSGLGVGEGNGGYALINVVPEPTSITVFASMMLGLLVGHRGRTR